MNKTEQNRHAMITFNLISAHIPLANIFSSKCTDRVSSLGCASPALIPPPHPHRVFFTVFQELGGEGWFNLVFLTLPASASGSVN